MSTPTASMRGSTKRGRKPAALVRRAAARTQARATSDARARVVDLSRVVEARRRIASGWYDRSDVRDRLVEAVLNEMRGR